MCKYSVGFQSSSINSCHEINRIFLLISILKQADLKKIQYFPRASRLIAMFSLDLLNPSVFLQHHFSLYKTYQAMEVTSPGHNNFASYLPPSASVFAQICDCHSLH